MDRAIKFGHHAAFKHGEVVGGNREAAVDNRSVR